MSRTVVVVVLLVWLLGSVGRCQAGRLPVLVTTRPPAATVMDVTPLYVGQQRAWTADTIGYPLERETSHTLRITRDGYRAVEVALPAGQTRLAVTLQPATWRTFLAFSWQYHRAAVALTVLALLACVAVPLAVHRRRLRSLDARLMLAELQSADLVGRVIDRYQVMERLGEGSFADVYRVEHIDYRDQWAMKILKMDVLDEEVRVRFYREMEAGRDLCHPSLVKVHAFGLYGERPYLVMELLRGGTLRSLLYERGRGLPVDQALSMFVPLAEGLVHAHEHGVVHRDLKPDNVLIDGEGRLRLMDFGIAKFVDRRRLTATGACMGTPGYMSPEHMDSATVDHRSDIYSAGVMLYEMISGHIPFVGEDPIRRLMKLEKRTPVPLSHWVPSVPPGVEAAVLRMLQRNPIDRFQSMQDALACLVGAAVPSNNPAPAG